MPRDLEKKLEKEADKKGLSGKRKDAYVYGTLRKTSWKPRRESVDQVALLSANPKVKLHESQGYHWGTLVALTERIVNPDLVNFLTVSAEILKEGTYGIAAAHMIPQWRRSVWWLASVLGEEHEYVKLSLTAAPLLETVSEDAESAAFSELEDWLYNRGDKMFSDLACALQPSETQLAGRIDRVL